MDFLPLRTHDVVIRRPLLSAQVLGWREGKWLVVTGSFKLDTTQFGLPIVRQFFLTVDKDVDVDIHLAFALPPELQTAVHP